MFKILIMFLNRKSGKYSWKVSVSVFRSKWRGGQVVFKYQHILKKSVGNIVRRSNTHFFSFSFHSLEGRFEDEELQQILDDIQTKRSFQY